MKRVLALILTVLMLVALFPASVMVQAESVTKEGFYLVNWDREMDHVDYKYDYVYGMPYTWIGSDKYNSDSEQINIGLYFDGYSTSNIEAAAQRLYEEFANRPAGSRYINLAAMASVFNVCVKDAIDMEDGVRLVADWLDRFLAEYKSLGGKLDGIAIDLEYNYYTSFYLESRFCNKYTADGETQEPRNLDILQDIVRNERVYQKIIRPQLVEYEKQGLFRFYTKDINPKTGLPDDLNTAVGPEYGVRVPIPVSEITTINRYDDNGGEANSRSTWSWVVSGYLADCITRASYEPLIKYYPDAVLSDYGTADLYSWHKTMSNTGGATGTSVKAGNASNGVFYGGQLSEYYWASYSGSKTRQLYYKPIGYNKAVFDPTDPFTRVLYDANNVKRLLSSARDRDGENAKINVWVPYFHYANTEKSYGNSAYFTEVMYHLGMANPEPFLGYIIKTEVQAKAKNYDDDNMGDYFYALQVTDDILTELSKVAGYSDRKAIELPISWNEDYILSGIYANGRNVWRITPNIGAVSLKDFKVGDDTPTFSVNGVTVTFPQGKIIKDSKITQIGSCGYWVETPANVTPVVTTTADRYAQNPSFFEDFSNYKTGAFTASSSSMLTTTSGRPDTYWTIKEKEVTAEIKKHGDNQTMALTGTTTLVNSKMAANITAGDKYADQQIWEVKVTLPASDKYSSVTLFGFDDTDPKKDKDDKTPNDEFGGFTLSGGKVKYDRNGIRETLENVDISAGGTYIFKRVFDFRKVNAYTSSYYVYDESGKLLGSAENVSVAIAGVDLPVSTVTMATASAAAAVELDDFKLYPTGVASLLELYETHRGRKITDTAAVRTEDTAYRFAWMNAGATHQVARIYDVKTGTIIKKIDMAPGADGLAVDVLRLSDGKEIQLAAIVLEEAPSAAGKEGDSITPYLKSEDNADPIVPGNTEVPGETGVPGDDTPVDGGKKGLSGGVIALIVIAVLAAAACAVYIFVIKNKFAAKATEVTFEENGETIEESAKETPEETTEE